MTLPKTFVDQEQKARMQVLADIRKNLESQLKPLKDNPSDEEIKKYCDLTGLINSTIRLEQAEKRFGVNQKIAIFSVVASIFTSGIVALITQYLIKSL